MAKQVLPLSDVKIRKAKAKDKIYKMYDGNGLILYVTPKGKKVFRFRYKLDGKEKTITIGDYGVFSLAEARDIVRGFKKDIFAGNDPKMKKPAPEEYSFKKVAEEFFLVKERSLSKDYVLKQQRRAEQYIYPTIADKNIKDVTKRDISDIVKNVKNVKTRNAKGGDKVETAKRVFTLVKQIFNFALSSDYIDINPAQKIDIQTILPKQKIKNFRAIVDEDRVKQMYAAIEAKDGNISSALKFLALTALRPGNVRFLKWEFVDIKNSIIIFPEGYMKMKRTFRLPLTKNTINILKQMKKISKVLKSDFVFTGKNSNHLSENTLNKAHKRLGFDHTAHGWRSSFSTICYEHQDEHGFGYEVIENQLAHIVGNASSRPYLRSDFFEHRKKLLEWWEKFLKG